MRVGDGPGSNSIMAGNAAGGVFQANLTNASGPAVLPAADSITFAANDPAIVITPVPGQPLQVQVVAPASDLGTSFQLAAQLSGPDFPTPVNLTPLTVAINQPTSGLPTGGTISQIS